MAWGRLLEPWGRSLYKGSGQTSGNSRDGYLMNLGGGTFTLQGFGMGTPWGRLLYKNSGRTP